MKDKAREIFEKKELHDMERRARLIWHGKDTLKKLRTKEAALKGAKAAGISAGSLEAEVEYLRRQYIAALEYVSRVETKIEIFKKRSAFNRPFAELG